MKNLPRLNNNVKFIIDNPFEPQPIFQFIQKHGNIDDKEMYQTFNMGMGFAVILNKNKVEESIKILKKHTKVNIQIVGHIEKGIGVEVPHLKINY